ncbi:MAG: hypothetical protein JF604_02285 [Bradyrhizobium sp.]|nr:hypothetical protein [Bradyrhizobium sp.]
MLGTPYHWSNVAIVGAGYVPAILFHPTRKDLMFARTDIGGAYRRDRATKTWAPIMDGLSPSPNWWYASPEAIGLDPNDPNRVYLAVGYYASPITGSIGWNGNGAMLISSDGGKTYLTIPLPFKNGANDNGRGGGERIAVDPGRSSDVYFGTRNAGVYLSTDYGASWNPMTGFPTSATMQNSKRSSDSGVVTMTAYMVGRSTAAFYAGVSATGSGSDAMGLYVTTEPGNTSAPWVAVEGQPTGMLVQHVVVGPNNRLYINYTDHEGPVGITDSQLWEFAPDSGYRSGKWRQIDLPGGPIGGLALSQSQPGMMLVSTVGRYSPSDTRWLSADYGTSWHEVGGNGASYDSSASPYIKNGSQNWESGVAIDPFNAAHAIYGTGGTVYETDNLTDGLNGGIVKWSTRGALGIEESSIVSLIAPPSGKTLLFAGLGDWGGFAFTDLAKSPAQGNLESMAPAYPSGLDFVQSRPNMIVAAVVPGWKPYPGPKAQISTDGGISWSGFAGGVTTKGGGTIAASADGKSFVWAPGDTGVQYRTGADWSPSLGVPGQAQVVSDRMAGGVFYGFSDGKLFMSRDGGRHFSIVQSNLPADGRLYVRPGARGDVWLASPGKGLYHSKGDNHIQLAKLDSMGGADLLAFGAPPSGSKTPTVFLWGKVSGRSPALFRSTDNGARFLRINDDDHQWPVGQRVLAGDMRRFGVVYIGTNGRGIIAGEP